MVTILIALHHCASGLALTKETCQREYCHIRLIFSERVVAPRSSRPLRAEIGMALLLRKYIPYTYNTPLCNKKSYFYNLFPFHRLYIYLAIHILWAMILWHHLLLKPKLWREYAEERRHISCYQNNGPEGRPRYGIIDYLYTVRVSNRFLML